MLPYDRAMTPVVPRKVWLPILVAAALVALFAIAGYYWAPRLIATQLRAFVEQRLQQRLELGEVRVRPFALAAELDGLAIREPDGALLVAVDRLALDLSSASIARLSLVVDRLELDRPRVAAVIRADRSLNLAALVPPRDPGAPPADPTAPLPVVELRELTIRDGAASLEDRGRSPVLRAEFRPVTLSLRDFSTRADGDNRYRIDARAASGERLAWSGRFEPRPFAAQGDFALSGLRAATLQRYARPWLPFDLAAGQLRLVLRYEVAPDADGRLDLRADVDRLDAAGLEIAPRDADAPAPLRIAGLSLRGGRLDLRARRLDLGRVALLGLEAEVVREPAGWNLARLLAPAPSAPPPGASAAPPASAAEGPRWSISLPRFALVDAAVRVEDRTREPAAVIPVDRLTLTALGVEPGGSTPVPVTASATIAGGAFTLRGDVTPGPVGARGRLSLRGFDLVTLAPYVADRVRLDLRRGLVDVGGEFVVEPSSGGEGAAPRIGFDGEATIRDLLTRDRAAGRDLLKWRRLGLAGLRYSSSPATLRIRQIAADAPYVDLVIGADGRTNLADVLAKSPAGEAGAPAAASAAPGAAPRDQQRPLSIEIDRVRIRNGSANFADLSITPNFGTGIQTLSGTITGLSSRAESRARVELEGAVDRYAPVKIAGEVNYLAARSYTDLRAAFRNLELTTLNPYSGRFAGYRIERGKLSVDLAYRIVDRKLEAQHKILLTQLQLGDRVPSKDAVSLPLKLAIALLKDRDGNIDLDLPVSGSLDDPQFRIGPIVWKMVVNLLTKIVAAPFTLLGSLFGGSGDDIRYVEFRPGDAALDDAMRERIGGVAKALAARPQLRLEVPLALDRARDGEALRDAAWQRELAGFAPAEVRAERARYLRLLGKRSEAAGIDTAALLEPLAAADPATGRKPDRDTLRERSIEALEQALRARVAVSDDDLQALARARANAVQDALLAGGEIDPLRVFITQPVEVRAEQDSVRLELALSAD
jgi:hypothetical protein